MAEGGIPLSKSTSVGLPGNSSYHLISVWGTGPIWRFSRRWLSRFEYSYPSGWGYIHPLLGSYTMVWHTTIRTVSFYHHVGFHLFLGSQSQLPLNNHFQQPLNHIFHHNQNHKHSTTMKQPIQKSHEVTRSQGECLHMSTLLWLHREGSLSDARWIFFWISWDGDWRLSDL